MKTKPTVRQLETLMAIADSGSFASAARLMQISQPAVSKQIAALERNVGYEIFTRTHGARPTVTPRGRSLIAHIPDLLLAVQVGGEGLPAAPSRPAELRIAAGDVICDLICLHLHRLYAAQPGITVEIVQVDPSVASIVQLERDDIDLAYLTLPAGISSRFGEPLSTVPAGIYVSSTEAVLTAWQPGSKQSLPIVGPTRGTTLDQELPARLRAQGVHKWHLVARAPLAAQRIQLALQGLGAILIMEDAVRPHLASGRLQRLPLPPSMLRRYRFMNRQRSHHAAVRQVDAFISSLIRSIG